MSRRRRQRFPSEPVRLHINSLSHEGRGVSNIDGKVCFVSGALPGEEVLARYVNSRRQFDELVTEKVIAAVSERVQPPCEFAGICGGCSLQHFNPDSQLAFKESVLLEHLSHHAGIDRHEIELLPRLNGPNEHYRRKARLAVRIVSKKGGALVGFREHRSSFITDMNNCQVLVAEAARLITPLRHLIDALQISREIPQIELAAGELGPDTDALQVALVLRHLAPLPDGDLERLRSFSEEWNVHWYLQPGGVDTVELFYPVLPQPRLHYFLPEFDLDIAFHPMDFTQINGDVNRAIVSRTMGLLALSPEDRVLDLFCGLGNFTLALARTASAVVGIEGSAAMVQRGQENAAHNRLINTQFYAADLSKTIASQPWVGQSYEKILLDPPRSGAAEIIDDVARLAAKRIVYVSCNPVTLARDAGKLLNAGYRLKSAGVMDMFPHTTHVESIALFETMD